MPTSITLPGIGEVPVVALGANGEHYSPPGFGSDDEEPIFLSPIQRRLRDRVGMLGFGGGISMLNALPFTSLGAFSGGPTTTSSTLWRTTTTTSDADGRASQRQARPGMGLAELHNRVTQLVNLSSSAQPPSAPAPHGTSGGGTAQGNAAPAAATVDTAQHRLARPPLVWAEPIDRSIGGRLADAGGNRQDAGEGSAARHRLADLEEADEYDADNMELDEEVDEEDLYDYEYDDDYEVEDEAEEDPYTEYFDDDDVLYDDGQEEGGAETASGEHVDAEADQAWEEISSGDSQHANQDADVRAEAGSRAPTLAGDGSSCVEADSEEVEPLLPARRIRSRVQSESMRNAHGSGARSQPAPEEPQSESDLSGVVSAAAPLMNAPLNPSAAGAAEQQQLPMSMTMQPVSEVSEAVAASAARRGVGMGFAWAAARFALSAVLVPLRFFMLVASFSSGIVGAPRRAQERTAAGAPPSAEPAGLGQSGSGHRAASVQQAQQQPQQDRRRTVPGVDAHRTRALWRLPVRLQQRAVVVRLRSAALAATAAAPDPREHSDGFSGPAPAASASQEGEGPATQRVERSGSEPLAAAVAASDVGTSSGDEGASERCPDWSDSPEGPAQAPGPLPQVTAAADHMPSRVAVTASTAEALSFPTAPASSSPSHSRGGATMAGSLVSGGAARRQLLEDLPELVHRHRWARYPPVTMHSGEAPRGVSVAARGMASRDASAAAGDAAPPPAVQNAAGGFSETDDDVTAPLQPRGAGSSNPAPFPVLEVSSDSFEEPAQQPLTDVQPMALSLTSRPGPVNTEGDLTQTGACAVEPFTQRYVVWRPGPPAITAAPLSQSGQASAAAAPTSRMDMAADAVTDVGMGPSGGSQQPAAGDQGQMGGQGSAGTRRRLAWQPEDVQDRGAEDAVSESSSGPEWESVADVARPTPRGLERLLVLGSASSPTAAGAAAAGQAAGARPLQGTLRHQTRPTDARDTSPLADPLRTTAPGQGLFVPVAAAASAATAATAAAAPDARSSGVSAAGRGSAAMMLQRTALPRPFGSARALLHPAPHLRGDARAEVLQSAPVGPRRSGPAAVLRTPQASGTAQPALVRTPATDGGSSGGTRQSGGADSGAATADPAGVLASLHGLARAATWRQRLLIRRAGSAEDLTAMLPDEDDTRSPHLPNQQDQTIVMRQLQPQPQQYQQQLPQALLVTPTRPSASALTAVSTSAPWLLPLPSRSSDAAPAEWPRAWATQGTAALDSPRTSSNRGSGGGSPASHPQAGARRASPDGAVRAVAGVAAGSPSSSMWVGTDSDEERARARRAADGAGGARQDGTADGEGSHTDDGRWARSRLPETDIFAAAGEPLPLHRRRRVRARGPARGWQDTFSNEAEGRGTWRYYYSDGNTDHRALADQTRRAELRDPLFDLPPFSLGRLSPWLGLVEEGESQGQEERVGGPWGGIALRRFAPGQPLMSPLEWLAPHPPRLSRGLLRWRLTDGDGGQPQAREQASPSSSSGVSAESSGTSTPPSSLPELVSEVEDAMDSDERGDRWRVWQQQDEASRRDRRRVRRHRRRQLRRQQEAAAQAPAGVEETDRAAVLPRRRAPGRLGDTTASATTDAGTAASEAGSSVAGGLSPSRVAASVAVRRGPASTAVSDAPAGVSALSPAAAASLSSSGDRAAVGLEDVDAQAAALFMLGTAITATEGSPVSSSSAAATSRAPGHHHHHLGQMAACGARHAAVVDLGSAVRLDPVAQGSLAESSSSLVAPGQEPHKGADASCVPAPHAPIRPTVDAVRSEASASNGGDQADGTEDDEEEDEDEGERALLTEIAAQLPPLDDTASESEARGGGSGAPGGHCGGPMEGGRVVGCGVAAPRERRLSVPPLVSSSASGSGVFSDSIDVGEDQDFDQPPGLCSDSDSAADSAAEGAPSRRLWWPPVRDVGAGAGEEGEAVQAMGCRGLASDLAVLSESEIAPSLMDSEDEEEPEMPPGLIDESSSSSSSSSDDDEEGGEGEGGSSSSSALSDEMPLLFSSGSGSLEGVAVQGRSAGPGRQDGARRQSPPRRRSSGSLPCLYSSGSGMTCLQTDDEEEENDGEDEAAQEVGSGDSSDDMPPLFGSRYPSVLRAGPSRGAAAGRGLPEEESDGSTCTAGALRNLFSRLVSDDEQWGYGSNSGSGMFEPRAPSSIGSRRRPRRQLGSEGLGSQGSDQPPRLMSSGSEDMARWSPGPSLTLRASAVAEARPRVYASVRRGAASGGSSEEDDELPRLMDDSDDSDAAYAPAMGSCALRGPAVVPSVRTTTAVQRGGQQPQRRTSVGDDGLPPLVDSDTNSGSSSDGGGIGRGPFAWRTVPRPVSSMTGAMRPRSPTRMGSTDTLPIRSSPTVGSGSRPAANGSSCGLGDVPASAADRTAALFGERAAQRRLPPLAAAAAAGTAAARHPQPREGVVAGGMDSSDGELPPLEFDTESNDSDDTFDLPRDWAREGRGRGSVLIRQGLPPPAPLSPPPPPPRGGREATAPPRVLAPIHPTSTPTTATAASGPPRLELGASAEAVLEALMPALLAARGSAGSSTVAGSAGGASGGSASARPRGTTSATPQILSAVIRLPPDVFGNVAPGSVLSISLPSSAGARRASSGGGGAAAMGAGGQASGGASHGGGGGGGVATMTGAVRLQLGGLSSFPASWRSYLPPEDTSGRHPNDRPGLPGTYNEEDIPAWAARFAPPRSCAVVEGTAATGPGMRPSEGAPLGATAATNLDERQSGRGISTSPPVLWEDFSFDGSTDGGETSEGNSAADARRFDTRDSDDGGDDHGSDNDDNDSLPPLIPSSPRYALSPFGEGDRSAAGSGGGGAGASTSTNAANMSSAGAAAPLVAEPDGAHGQRAAAAAAESTHQSAAALNSAAAGQHALERLDEGVPAIMRRLGATLRAQADVQPHDLRRLEQQQQQPHESHTRPRERRSAGPVLLGAAAAAAEALSPGAARGAGGGGTGNEVGSDTRSQRGSSAPARVPLPPMPLGAGAVPAGPPRPTRVSRYVETADDDSSGSDGQDEGPDLVAARNNADGQTGGTASDSRGAAGVGGGAGAAAEQGPPAVGSVPMRRNAVTYPRSVLLEMLEALRGVEVAANAVLEAAGSGGGAAAGGRGSEGACDGHTSGRDGPSGGAVSTALAAPGQMGGRAGGVAGATGNGGRQEVAVAAFLQDDAFVRQLLEGMPGVSAEPPAACVREMVRWLCDGEAAVRV